MFKITNQTAGRIVLNSINAILSSNGVVGDSTVIDDEKRLSKEIMGLERNGFILVKKITKKDLKTVVKKQIKQKNVIKNVMSPKDTQSLGGPDGKQNKAIVVSEGKVKTSKMVQSIERNGELEISFVS